jgi:hypothetical protein
MEIKQHLRVYQSTCLNVSAFKRSNVPTFARSNVIMPDIEKRLQSIENKLDQKADKKDIRLLSEQNHIIIGILEKQSQTLDIIRIEQRAIAATLSLHEERIGDLEERVFGHRVRENDAEYGKNV